MMKEEIPNPNEETTGGYTYHSLAIQLMHFEPPSSSLTPQNN